MRMSYAGALSSLMRNRAVRASVERMAPPVRVPDLWDEVDPNAAVAGILTRVSVPLFLVCAISLALSCTLCRVRNGSVSSPLPRGEPAPGECPAPFSSVSSGLTISQPVQIGVCREPGRVKSVVWRFQKLEVVRLDGSEWRRL